MPTQQRLTWAIMFGLLALYVVGLAAGWAVTASWHLLLVIIAILLLYNIFTRRAS